MAIALYTHTPPATHFVRQLAEAGYTVATTAQTHRSDIVQNFHPSEVTVLLTGLEPIDQTVLDRYPNLQLIALSSTGTDNLDLAAAADRQISVSNVPHLASEEVATHALALILNLIRNISVDHSQIQTGHWNLSSDRIVAPRASSLKLGIIGLGRIGQELLRVSSALFATCAGYDPFLPEDTKLTGLDRYKSLDQLIEESDILSLHLPLNGHTEHLLGVHNLGAVSRGKYLVNVSRGGLIAEQDILQLLESGHLLGVGLDVFEIEPPKLNTALFKHPRVITTPHRAFESHQTLESYVSVPISNAIALAHGQELPSRVNLPN